MFRRRKHSEQTKPAPPQAPSGSDSESEAVVDTLAAVLRSVGDFSLDLEERTGEEIQRLYDGWARHALVGAPRPELDPPDSDLSGGRRDWISLRRFVADHRRQEFDYASHSLQDLKQVIWLFIQGLGRAVPEDEKADAQISDQLSRLGRAVRGNDVDALRREALASIGLIEQLFEERKERQRHHIRVLSSEIQEISGELTDTREKMSLDRLTEIYNRAALDQHVDRLVNLGIVFGRPAWLFMIDIDHFKWVNDKFGHTSGDDVLRQVAGCLRQGFRRKGDFVARFGGDEFAATIQEATPEIVNRLAERLIFSVHSLAVENPEEPIRVTVSVGAARLSPGEEAKAWLERADRALYQAKELGRDRVVVDFGPQEAGPTAAAPSER